MCCYIEKNKHGHQCCRLVLSKVHWVQMKILPLSTIVIAQNSFRNERGSQEENMWGLHWSTDSIH